MDSKEQEIEHVCMCTNHIQSTKKAHSLELQEMWSSLFHYLQQFQIQNNTPLNLKDVHTLKNKGVSFKSNVSTLESVDCFAYLSRSITVDISDWPVVIINMNKRRGQWASYMTSFQSKPAGYFFKTLVHSVLLYYSEMWILTSSILQVH
jgi:hypothetical protein